MDLTTLGVARGSAWLSGINFTRYGRHARAITKIYVCEIARRGNHAQQQLGAFHSSKKPAMA